jgi:hypothetical protein
VAQSVTGDPGELTGKAGRWCALVGPAGLRIGQGGAGGWTKVVFNCWPSRRDTSGTPKSGPIS